MNIQSITGTAQSVIEFIFALGALIILHELGHFLVARLLKIEVEEFGLASRRSDLLR
jgi:membrane-associated protease RseP (regulator of RpoE activity)